MAAAEKAAERRPLLFGATTDTIGALADFAGTRTMILTNAVLVFAGALYLAFATIQHRKQDARIMTQDV